MATIRTAIQIYDGMSPAFKSMNTAMTIVLNSFEALQSASHNAIDTNSIQLARQELAKAEVSFNQIDKKIQDAKNQEDKFNNSIHNGALAANNMNGAMSKIITTVATYIGLTKTLDLADRLTSTTARLNIMNDGLKTTAELQKDIYRSAQDSRTSYLDTAAVVSKLGILAGDAFSNNQEMIFFAEQMNKQFKIGGSSIQEQSAAMYQLTQAMAAGRLQGDEFRTILEGAPMLAKSIENYMKNVKGIDLPLKEMSAQGLLTAEVIKTALFSVADETNKTFATMPVTFSQVWTGITNKAIIIFEPLLTKISQIANSENFQKFTDGAINSLATVANVVMGVFNVISAVAGFLYDNWSMIAPVVWGIVTAMIAYNAVSLITNGIIAAQAFADKVGAAAKAMQTGQTFAATVAQYGLNAALYACPLTWIILLIIGLIAVFYGVIAAVNHFAGTSISATGAIFGAFAVLGAFLWNTFLGVFDLILGVINALVNPFIRFTNFLGNVFTSPISSIIYLFQGMADGVLGMLESMAKMIDQVFGSHLSDGVSNWRDGLKQMADNAVKVYAPKENYKNLISELNLSSDSLGLKRWDYGDAWNVGYNAGQSLENSFTAANVFDEIKNGVTDTAGNTSKIADTVETSEEELKYLRDLAEQEVINRFTTAEIKVDMGGVVNNVNKNVDLDGVVTYLEEKLYETMTIAAEGVHS